MLEPVKPALHARAVRLDEPRDRRLVSAVRDVAPAHDLRQPHDQLRDRAGVARRAAAPSPLLPPPPPPQVPQHRDRRRLKPRVPRKRATALLAGVPDRGQDLDADRLRRQRRGVTERPARLRARRTRTRMTSDCHRQRRTQRRSRRQSAHNEQADRGAIRHRQAATGQRFRPNRRYSSPHSNRVFVLGAPLWRYPGSALFRLATELQLGRWWLWGLLNAGDPVSGAPSFSLLTRPRAPPGVVAVARGCWCGGDAVGGGAVGVCCLCSG